MCPLLDVQKGGTICFSTRDTVPLVGRKAPARAKPLLKSSAATAQRVIFPLRGFDFFSDTKAFMQALTPYELLGGEAMLRRLVSRFYQIMDEDPVALEVRRMHPQDLSESEEKLFMFLSGWLGGPSLYMEKYGHPRLRARHMPFAIDDFGRDQWMHCMRRAMDELPIEPELKKKLDEALWNTADFMRNR